MKKEYKNGVVETTEGFIYLGRWYTRISHNLFVTTFCGNDCYYSLGVLGEVNKI